MARDVNHRLTRLGARRSGTDRIDRLSAVARTEVLAKSLTREAWQDRTPNRPNTKYTLGAMQEVDEDYTRISLETADRVGNQLNQGLTKNGLLVDFRLQGSVPLNVHIRGVSDVDLLVIDVSFLTYATYGALSQSGHYYSPTDKTSIKSLIDLRNSALEILRNKYPAADVDNSGGKAINISGGSLARPVDVVPSHWHDNVEYQNSRAEYDRGVTILNKKVPETVDNIPFRHIKKIRDRCDLTFGGLRKAIRLCKNIKSDAEIEGSEIGISSYEIASLLFHADVRALGMNFVHELSVLAEAQRFMDYLYHNIDYAKTLVAPDGSRTILNNKDSVEGMKQLSHELDDLLRNVAMENSALLAAQSDQLLLSSSRDFINRLKIV